MSTDNKEYFLLDDLGSPLRQLTSTGQTIGEYGYDEFGQSLFNVPTKQPFGFTGYQYDDLSGLNYAQARYYDQNQGRFVSKDVDNFIRFSDSATLNLYNYCQSNPVNFIDPMGFEKIVVSGGDAGKVWKNMFIEAGISGIRNQPSDDTTWIIMNDGYSDSDIENFRNTANDLGVNIEIMNNKGEFIDYLNNQHGNRKDDKITAMNVYSHGLEGEVAFGYGGNPNDFNLQKSDLSEINSDAFDCFMKTEFYSCNTGTGGANSFAQYWADLTRGEVMAAIGKTDYTDDSNFFKKIWRKLFNPRKKFDYDPKGNKIPKLSKDAEWKIFYPSSNFGQCLN